MNRQISIYLHFPFCIKKCNYCDFVSFPICANDYTDFLRYYLKELDLYFNLLGKKCISSIYFGGGTPSLMKPEWLEQLLEKIYTKFNVIDNPEITLEVNPGTVDEKKIKQFYYSGINRLSIGVQSLNDEELKFLGRIHNSIDALKIIDVAKKYFDNINCDFIYALPNQSFEQWQYNLDNIVKLNLNHMSLYELIIEPKTNIYKQIKNKVLTPLNERLSLKMFQYTNKFLKNICPQYEVSNYSKKSYESKHNLNYWNGGDYLGIGVSSVGRFFVDGLCYNVENPKSINEWKYNLDNDTLLLKKLPLKQRAKELVIMGLRKNKGIFFDEFFQNSLTNIFDILNMKNVQNLVNNKFLIYSKNNIRCSSKGKNILDAILREIIN